MKFIFGPINSRRFGISLGIDLSPDAKQCNFDCIYCELNGAKTMQEQSISHKPDIILDEISTTLKNTPKIDVLTITANGEPTLYPFLDELLDGINKLKEIYNFKTLILSNSGKIMHQHIQKVLSKIDIVKLSLDCVSRKCFRKLDRINKNINCEDILQGIKDFRAIYTKELVLEVLFVKDVNDNQEEIALLSKAIREIKPNRVDINTIDRPPAYDYKGLNAHELDSVCKLLGDVGCDVVAATPKNTQYQSSTTKSYFSKDDILHTLKRRPLSSYDVEVLFDDKSKQNLKQLSDEQKIKLTTTNEQNFFVLN